jgi:outer membrane protein assembly factor BamB
MRSERVEGKKVGRIPRLLARTGLLAVVAGTFATAVSGGQVALAAPDQSTAYQLDIAHDGHVPDSALATPLTQEWSVALPGAASYPLVVNGMVFVTAADKTLHALNQATGSTVWSHFIGGIFPWSGLAYDRGQVFALNSSGLLTAYDPTTGSVGWSESLPGQSFFSSAPTAAGGIVYVGGAGVGGTVYAVRERDGRLLWTQSVENGDQSSPAVDAQAVYVSYACGQDYAFARTAGNLLWHHDASCEGGGGKTPIVASDIVFARDNILGNLMLSAATGSVLGAFNAGPAPAVANDVAFMLNASNLKAIADAGQGSTLWQFTGDGNLDTAPLVMNGLVFVGSSAGNLYALDAATGTTSWSTNVGSAIPGPDEQNVSQPLTGLGAANGTLVVPAGSQLIAYRTAGSITSPPVNQSPPSIDGVAQEGEILAADVGIWSGLPNAYSYQWELCDSAGASCTDIGGAAGASFTPTAGDIGSTLRVQVVASNGHGSSAPVQSAATPVVIEAAPVNLTLPTITGTAQENETLTASHGTWTGDPSGYSYQWRRCDSGPPLSCADITGANDASYTAVAADVGHELEVRVVATNAGGDSDPADSAPTSPVLPAPPVNESPPTVLGVPQEGQTLTADVGQWSGNPTSYAYQWFRCDPSGFSCPDIGGATHPTYLVQAADVGEYIGVEVTARNAGGDSEPADSDVIGPVVPGPPVNLAPPSISGTAQVGETLNVSTGTWTGSPMSFSYQWYSCTSSLDTCIDIPGASGSSYRIGAGDLGRRLIASVIATNSGGDSDEELSNLTDPVLPARPVVQVAPAISGSARQGQMLTADHGTWTNNPTGYGYQWRRCSSSGSGCADIVGASAAAYELGAADVGRRLVVEVVAVNAGGDSAPADSTPTDVVVGPKCHVPNVVGLKLAKARARIRARHCSVGRITRRASRPTKKGRVLWQSPKAGRTLPDRAKVNLRVGKGRA